MATQDPGAPAPGADQQYELVIALIDADPDIERSVVIADQTTLADLHLVIQAAMGWTNSHLHMFTTPAGVTYGDSSLDELGDADESDVVVADVLRAPRDTLRYEYDFGDSWEHRVGLVAVRSGEQSRPDAPACIAGKGACPPEDCGGLLGYRELRDALTNPSAEHDAELREWAEEMVGLPFDENAFDLAGADAAVRGLVGNDGRMRWPNPGG